MRGTSWLRTRAAPVLASAAVALSGCSAIGGGAAGPAPDNLGMGCEQSETFLFSGQTSLEAIGLEEFAGGPDARRVGMVWVTAEPVSMSGPGPLPPGVPEGPLERMVCVEWPDGSGMAGPVPPGWQPPNAIDLDASAEGELPVVLIGLIVAVLVIVGVSVVAFRADAPA
jgi:hypothetical protein